MALSIRKGISDEFCDIPTPENQHLPDRQWRFDVLQLFAPVAWGSQTNSPLISFAAISSRFIRHCRGGRDLFRDPPFIEL